MKPYLEGVFVTRAEAAVERLDDAIEQLRRLLGEGDAEGDNRMAGQARCVLNALARAEESKAWLCGAREQVMLAKEARESLEQAKAARA